MVSTIVGFRRWPLVAVAALATLSACVADDDADTPGEASAGEEPTGEGPTGEASGPLVGGTYTSLRPEIGRLVINGLGCTGSLVDPKFVLTAAHCIRYTNANVAGSFTITSKQGLSKQYGVDRVFSLGAGDPNNLVTGVGPTDVAVVRLSTAVPATDADPTYIWPSWPSAGVTQTIFGYGCQNRTTGAGEVAKQYFQTTAGQTTSALCKGDSGGPVLWYGASGSGPVFAVNSGYSNSGADIFGDASTHGLLGLAAVTRFSNTTVVNATSEASSMFAALAAVAGAKAVAGDFNGDGLSDIALTGGSGWATIIVALSKGDGTFNLTSQQAGAFPSMAAQSPSARPLAGDFNNDGRADIALVGGPGWTSVPVAFSNGNGSFSVTNNVNNDIAVWAQTPGVQAVAGDFNGDHFTDIALTGPGGFQSIPVGFSGGNGNFWTTNLANPQFAAWAASPGAKAVAADFDGDGDADIALTGVNGWSSIPVALSNRTGSFTVTNHHVPHFPQWAASGAKVVAADFDGDTRADLALVGGPGWITVPFALSNGDGDFTAASLPLNDIPAWSRDARFAFAGKFNHDGQADLALAGGTGWKSAPVALFSR